MYYTLYIHTHTLTPSPLVFHVFVSVTSSCPTLRFQTAAWISSSFHPVERKSNHGRIIELTSAIVYLYVYMYSTVQLGLMYNLHEDSTIQIYHNN